MRSCMHKVGFNGGGLLVEMGSASVMSAFFDILRRHAVGHDEQSLICDRLYRRYVRAEDAEATMQGLVSIRTRLARIEVTAIDEDLSGEAMLASKVVAGACTVDHAFSQYFDAIARCIESADSAYRRFGSQPKFEYEYEPLRVVRSEIPAFVMDKRVPLLKYDELVGDPFWISGNAAREIRPRGEV